MKAIKVEADIPITEKGKTFSRKIVTYTYTTGFDDLDKFFGLNIIHYDGSVIRMITNTISKTISLNPGEIVYSLRCLPIDSDTISNDVKIKIVSQILDMDCNAAINSETMSKINQLNAVSAELVQESDFETDSLTIKFMGIKRGNLSVYVIIKGINLLLGWENPFKEAADFTKSSLAELFEERAKNIDYYTNLGGSIHKGIIMPDKIGSKRFRFSFELIILAKKYKFEKSSDMESFLRTYISEDRLESCYEVKTNKRARND